MMIKQYNPEAPYAGNALHRLQHMRMEAGLEAQEGWKRVKSCTQELLHPQEEHSTPKTLLGSLLANAHNIATGFMMGMKIMRAVRSLTRR